jgi:hypothetical protein
VLQRINLHGGGRTVAGRFSLAVNAKIHVSKCKNVRLNGSYRLVTTVLVVNSQCGKIHNIFPTTIAAATSFQPRWTSMVQR